MAVLGGSGCTSLWRKAILDRHNDALDTFKEIHQLRDGSEPVPRNHTAAMDMVQGWQCGRRRFLWRKHGQDDCVAIGPGNGLFRVLQVWLVLDDGVCIADKRVIVSAGCYAAEEVDI